MCLCIVYPWQSQWTLYMALTHPSAHVPWEYVNDTFLHTQDSNSLISWVTLLQEEEKDEEARTCMDKCGKHFLRYYACLTIQIKHFWMLVIFHTFFTLISLKESTWNWKWKWRISGIDHSNPYIHSTTVLCDGCIKHLRYTWALLKPSYTQSCLPHSLKSCQCSICDLDHSYPKCCNLIGHLVVHCTLQLTQKHRHPKISTPYIYNKQTCRHLTMVTLRMLLCELVHSLI